MGADQIDDKRGPRDGMFLMPEDPDLSHIGATTVTQEHTSERDAIVLKSGHKDDTGKAPFHLIPPEFLFALAAILEFGAKKYAERNWEKGISYSRLFSALMRHMWAWWGGKGPTSTNFGLGTLDEETKYSHLWHAGFCIMAMATFEDRGRTDLDDRPSQRD